jgi:hypothetical protein
MDNDEDGMTYFVHRVHPDKKMRGCSVPTNKLPGFDDAIALYKKRRGF